MNHGKCEVCKYWEQHKEYHELDGTGECHRYPRPWYTYTPDTHRDYWCGEWVHMGEIE